MSTPASPSLPIVQMEHHYPPPLPPPSLHVPPPPPPPNPRIRKSRFSFLPPDHKRLVYKSTPRSKHSPSSNHVNALTHLLNSPGLSIEEQQATAIDVATTLTSRLAVSAPSVQLNTHILLHHLLRRVSYPIIRYIAQTIHNSFNHRPVSEPKLSNRLFIAHYHTYLESRTALTASFDFPPTPCDENDPALAHIFIQLSLPTLQQLLPSVIRVVHSLVASEMYRVEHNHLFIPAFTMLKRDLSVFCTSLSAAITRVVQLFDHLDMAGKSNAWRLVIAYTALVGRVKRFAVGAVEIPTQSTGSWAELPAVHADVFRRMRAEAEVR